jgi:hypothetical protein
LNRFYLFSQGFGLCVLAAEVAHTRELLERQAELRGMARGKSS